MDYVDYINQIPPSFIDFYHMCRLRRPDDLPMHPRGFPPSPEDYRCSNESAHMGIFEYISSQCEKVTEFGLREGYSTAAFCRGLFRNRKHIKSLTTIDIEYKEIVTKFRKWNKNDELGCEWNFIQRNTVIGEPIEYTDYLHVDDWHTYNHVRQELEIHGGQVGRFLSFHDVYSQGTKSRDSGKEMGIRPAILEFTRTNGWELIYSVDFNHGLWIFEKI